MWTNFITSWSLDAKNAAAERCAVDVVSRSSECTGIAALLKLPAQACCGMPPALYPYIETPTFVSENTADSYQVFVQNQAPESATPQTEAYVDYLRNILAGSLEESVAHGVDATKNGMFAPACLAHCLQWDQAKAPLVDGMNHRDAFSAWWTGRTAGGAPSMHLNNASDFATLMSCTDIGSGVEGILNF
jgi:hypothetical protein